MKLVIAIVHDEDSYKVVEELNKNGFFVTRLCSTGGFLKAGNTTLLAGVDESKVDQAIGIVRSKSRSRARSVEQSVLPGGFESSYSSYPIEVTVGGATIFVTDVERFVKA